jgi:hypothetical protein
MLLASGTCNPPVANPPSGPIDIPGDGGEEAAAPVNDPQTQCEVAWSVAADAECPPSMGHDAWLAKCLAFTQGEVDCVIVAESCLALRSCKGFQ